MDTSSSGISLLFLIFFAFCSCALSSQLYLQPTTNDHAHFTGEDFFITCFTTDETIDKLQWSDFDGNPISGDVGRIHVQPAEGIQMGLRLVFTNVEKEDAGPYTCADDTDSVNFELVVYRAVSFSDTPKVQHAPEKENAVVLCNVRADPKPVVNWYFKGKMLSSNKKYTIQENHNLEIHNLSREDAGEYKCKAFIITPLTSQVKDFDITLHVQYLPEVIGEKKLTTYASKNHKKSLMCNVTAVPVPMFQWWFDEMIIHNNTDNFVVHNTDNSSVLELIMDHADKQGQYICRASNPLGEGEVIIDLIEGETPLAPVLNVIGQEQEIVKLSITMPEDDKPTSVEDMTEYLEVAGYKVEYMLSLDTLFKTWDTASIQEFEIGDQYELKNMSFNSEYTLRASARNAAGYGNYSEKITYTTLTFQSATVIGGASEIHSSLGLLLISIFLFFSL